MPYQIRYVVIVLCLTLSACAAMGKPPPPLPPDLRDDIHNVAFLDFNRSVLQMPVNPERGAV